MCGIIAGFTDNIDVTRLAHRGPDAAAARTIGAITLGHTRLAIIDPVARSDQPFVAGPVTIAFNGEVFNHRALRESLTWEWATESDTETLAAGIATEGPSFLTRIDGMFAVAWADERDNGTVLHMARDRQGEIPLHLDRSSTVMVASERKALDGRGDAVVDIPAGTYVQVRADRTITTTVYHHLASIPREAGLDEAAACTRKLLTQAVASRSIADVGVCTLLSGGIDSAIIAYELKQLVPDLVCYTAVMDPRSPDLRAARVVAGAIGAPLIEVAVPAPTADDLTRVVAVIEQPTKTQVEIGWPCIKLAEAIRGDGYKVTFSGEGSDELWGSYEMSYHGILKEGWFGYRRNLTARQAAKNFPRVNKVFMGNSVEARLPFCDPAVVDYALSLPMDAVRTGKGPSQRKAVLSRAYADVLPSLVTERPKIAFQTGLGLAKVIPVPDPARYYRAEFSRLYG